MSGTNKLFRSDALAGLLYPPDNPLSQRTPLAEAYSFNAPLVQQHFADQLRDVQDPAYWRDMLGQYANALLMGTSSPRAAPSVLYHVAGPDWRPGDSLKSLFSRYGNAAYEMYAKRWPEAGDLAQYHPHYTMFYDELGVAQDHPTDGRLLKVDTSKLEGLRFDKLESPGYWVTNHDVPANAIQEIPRQ